MLWHFAQSDWAYYQQIKRAVFDQKHSSPFFCGPAEIRTLVQTSNNPAFYMLILPTIFVKCQRGRRPDASLSS